MTNADQNQYEALAEVLINCRKCKLKIISKFAKINVGKKNGSVSMVGSVKNTSIAHEGNAIIK